VDRIVVVFLPPGVVAVYKRSWMFLPLFALVASFGLATPAPAVAADAKPVAVVSIAGYDAMMSDLDFLGTLSDAPQLGQIVEGFLSFFTKAQGMAGLDKAKPIGLAVSLDPMGPPKGFAFVPVSDSEKLLDALALAIPETEELGDGFKQLKIKNSGMPLIMIEKGGWAFLSISKDHLSDLPADPSKLLGDLPSKYDLAVQINVGNVPEPLVDMAMQQIRGGASQALRNRLPNETEEQYEARKKLTGDLIEASVEQIRQIDQITVGTAIDSKTRSAYLDAAVTMKAGSEMAKQINAAAEDAKPTRFGGISDDENPAGLYVSSPITEGDQAMILELLGEARKQIEAKIADEFATNEEAKALFTTAAGDSLDVVKATIEEGLIDGAAAILGEGPFSVVAAVHVADGMKLNGVFKKLIGVAAQAPNAPPIKLDAEEKSGITFHTVEIPLDDDATEFFGEASLTIGFGKNTVVIGVGEEPIESVSEALDGKAEDDGPPAKGQVHIAPFLAIGVEKENNEREKAMMQVALDVLEASEKDRIVMTSGFIPNGQKSRLEVEEGILKAIGKLAMQAVAAGGR
jgi:hypothetical protein